MAVESTVVGGPFPATGTGGSPGNLPTGTGVVKVVSDVGAVATKNTDYMDGVAGSGIVKVTARVPSLAAANTDYMPAVASTGLVKVASGAAGAAYATDGIVKMTSGVPGAAVANADFFPAVAATGLVKVASGAAGAVYATNGILKMTSGVPGAAVANTDFMGALSGSSLVKVVAGVPTAAVAGTDYATASTEPLVVRTYRQAGLTALGLTAADDYAVDFDDYLAENPVNPVSGIWYVSTSGTGTFGTVATIKGSGTFVTTSGAATGLIYGIAGSTSNAPQVENSKTNKWYFAWRGCITTSITSDTLAADGLINLAQNKVILIGFSGKAHATNFSIHYDSYFNAASPSVVNLGVAADTAVHIFEMWGDGAGNIYGRIDGGSISSAGVQGGSAPADGLKRSWWTYNAGAGPARVVERDWAILITKRDS